MSSKRQNNKKSRAKEFDKIYIQPYYDDLKKKRESLAQKRLNIIRKQILIQGCPDDDIISEIRPNPSSVHEQAASDKVSKKIGVLGMGGLPTIRKAEDTVRGRLWRICLSIHTISSDDYQKQIKLKENKQNYIDIRKDTGRTFVKSLEYNSRVSEERLIRILNSFTHKYKKRYAQGMNCIAAALLYVMPEVYAYNVFSILMNDYCPTYFEIKNDDKRNGLIGTWAGSFLAQDILKLCDNELYQHLKPLNPYLYIFPLIISIQSLSQPFNQLLKLWDFLFCFGIHLNPVVTAAQLITNRDLILAEKNVGHLLQGILGQRNWMNHDICADKIIDKAMICIIELKKKKNEELWNNILKHASDFKVAQNIKWEHDKQEYR